MSSETPNAPQPAPFFPIDIPKTAAQALQYDTQNFDWGNQDFLQRFPGLVATRNQQVDQAYSDLTGPLDPTIQNQFVNQGIGTGLNATGGGDPLSGLGQTQGSFGQNTAASTFTKEVMGQQDYNTNNLLQLILNNPQQSLGLSGGDIANLAIANTGGLNASNQQQYQSTLAGIYGQGQQNVATGQQIAALGSILGRLNVGGGLNGGLGYGGPGG